MTNHIAEANYYKSLVHHKRPTYRPSKIKLLNDITNHSKRWGALDALMFRCGDVVELGVGKWNEHGLVGSWGHVSIRNEHGRTDVKPKHFDILEWHKGANDEK